MKKKILALTTINATVPLEEAIRRIKEEYGNIVEVRKIYFDDYENPDIPLKPIEEEINSSDIILVDIRGDVRVGRELPEMLKGKDKTIVVLVAGSPHIFALTKMGKFKGEMIFKLGREKEFNVHTYIRTKKFTELIKKIGYIFPFGMLKDIQNWILSQEYYGEGDAENLKNLILLLLKEYGRVKEIRKIPPPKIFNYGLYLPGKGLLDDIQKYKKMLPWNPKKPVVGALLYGGMHFDECKVMADALYEHLKNDVNLIFIASKVTHNIEAINKYLKDIDIDLFLNLQYFRIHGGPYGGEPEPTYQFLQKADVPLLIGLRAYSTDIEKWKKSTQGLDPLEVVIGVTLPELDGGIEPIFISGLESFDTPALGKTKKPKILEDRVKKLAARIKNWIALRNKPNDEKRVAIITYNYPPGEDNLASAGYLDVFESLKIFLKNLKEKGYKVEIPSMSLKELFLSSGIVNSPNYIQKSGLRVAVDKYVSWFKSLPQAVQEDVIAYWGDPPGNVMVDSGNILIPGIILGNVFLGIQPSRGVHEDPDKAYHDKDLPPHHQYLAYYFFLEKEFRADAIIHFGMHGTLEFTKGKEVALSSECFPDILIGNMPHIYYYWIGNTSESTIAKRRSYAICISHASPPMRSSGLYEKYIVLDDLLTQYEENKDEKTLEVLKEVANELHLLPESLGELRKELHKMKRRLIPYGLHIMDRKPTREELVEYLLSVLRIERDFPSILKFLAERKGLKWEQINYSRAADEIEREAKEVIRSILDGKHLEWLPKEYSTFVKYIVDNIQKSSESEGLLRALEGRYITPARGGDPVRDPNVYPTGRAMYAFDPRLIPTVAAEIRGKKAAELLIDSYLKKCGKYPECIGIVLWGFETMKTGGDTIATILSLLGVKIKHKKSPWFKELEIIPIEELNRPRIDVVVTICGIFRDTFGTHIELINRAIEMVAELDEPLEIIS